jgi:hypothetical protein
MWKIQPDSAGGGAMVTRHPSGSSRGMQRSPRGRVPGASPSCAREPNRLRGMPRSPATWTYASLWWTRLLASHQDCSRGGRPFGASQAYHPISMTVGLPSIRLENLSQHSDERAAGATALVSHLSLSRAWGQVRRIAGVCEGVGLFSRAGGVGRDGRDIALGLAQRLPTA